MTKEISWRQNSRIKWAREGMWILVIFIELYVGREGEILLKSWKLEVDEGRAVRDNGVISEEVSKFCK